MTHLMSLAFADAPAGNPIFQFIPLILIFGIFWFLLIAPMRKRQKAQQEMIANLQKGDRVITNGGLHGEVTSVKDDVLVLKLGENVKVTVSKSAISGLQGAEGS